MLVGSVVYMAIDRRIDPGLVVAMASAAIPIYFNQKHQQDAEAPTPPAPPVVSASVDHMPRG